MRGGGGDGFSLMHEAIGRHPSTGSGSSSPRAGADTCPQGCQEEDDSAQLGTTQADDEPCTSAYPPDKRQHTSKGLF